MLTARQSRILGLILRYRNEHGYAPAVRDIHEQLGISVATVHSELGELEKDRRIRRTPGKPRTIDVLLEGQGVEPSASQLVRVPLLVGEIGAGVSIQEDGWTAGWMEREFYLPRDLVGSESSSCCACAGIP